MKMWKNKLRHLVLGALAALITITPYPSFAATVYSQIAPSTNGTISTANSGFTVYDGFTLNAEATIQSIIWRGTYNPTIVTADNFTISFYENAGGPIGSIGTQKGSFSVGDNTNRTVIGTLPSIPFYTEFEYSSNLGAGGLTLGSGSYFVSIVNTLPLLPPPSIDYWSWSTFAQGGLAIGDGNLTEFSNGTANNRFQSYYSLEGATVNPVPIPAALPLFLSGLLGLGVIARRRKKIIA